MKILILIIRFGYRNTSYRIYPSSLESRAYCIALHKLVLLVPILRQVISEKKCLVWSECSWCFLPSDTCFTRTLLWLSLSSSTSHRKVKMYSYCNVLGYFFDNFKNNSILTLARVCVFYALVAVVSRFECTKNQ